VVVLGVPGFSRVHVFSTCLMVFVLECLTWGTYNKIFNSRATDRLSLKNITASIKMENTVSWPLIFMDLF